jgi:hypothetical protein
VDSYNLSWKLIHSLHGLTPAHESGDRILDTFETERQTIAQELIAFDKDFSSMFSGKIGAGDGQESLTHEQFLEVFSTGNGFTSGCGIEYPENLLVEKTIAKGVVHGTDYLSGVLRPGRRLLNVKVKRHTDSVRRDLQDGKSFLLASLTLVTDETRFPLHGPFPHPLLHINGSPHCKRHLLYFSKPNFNHPYTISVRYRRIGRPSCSGIKYFRLERYSGSRQNSFGNEILQWD